MHARLDALDHLGAHHLLAMHDAQVLRGTADEGKLMATLTNVLVPVGIVGVGLGITLLATSGPTETRDARSRLRVTPTAGGMIIAGSF